MFLPIDVRATVFWGDGRAGQGVPSGRSWVLLRGLRKLDRELTGGAARMEI